MSHKSDELKKIYKKKGGGGSTNWVPMIKHISRDWQYH